jgi:hypothetical protein
MPRMPLRDGVRILLNLKDSYPRPSLDCGFGAPRTVPLRIDTSYLQRVGTPPELEWIPTLVAQPRGTAVIVDADVPPLRPPAPDQPKPSPLQLLPQEPPLRHYEPLRWQVSPDRLRGGPTSADEPKQIPVPPAIRVTPVETIEADGRYVGLAGSWFTIDVTVDRAQRSWYRLGETELFGLDGQLVVAPGPRHPLSLLEIFSVDASTLAVTSLGRPAVTGGSWRQEVSDARSHDGSVEVLVLEREPSPKPERGRSVWGVLLRHEPDGTWSEHGRVPLPDEAPIGSLRFDRADPSRLVLVTADGHAWTRPLA